MTKGVIFMKSRIKLLAALLTCMLVAALCPAALASAAEEEKYPLWIGGTQVTSTNCNDLSGNKWSYDPVTHILTLDGYKYTGEGYNYNASLYACIYYNGADDLTILRKGDSSVNQTRNYANSSDHVLKIDNPTADLFFTGSGSLELRMYDDWAGPAVSCIGDVEIKGGSLTVDGGLGGIDSPKVTIRKDVTSAILRGHRDSAKAVTGNFINETDGMAADRFNRVTKLEPSTTEVQCVYKALAFPIAKYKLVFDPNGGTGSMDPVTVSDGDNYKFPECGFEAPDGKVFSFWRIDIVDVIVLPGNGCDINNAYVSSGVITVVAAWKDAPAATVKTAPKEKILTYTGNAMDLVTAGEATDGEMQYALGNDATNAPATGWSKSIPQGNDAKPYYVWYRAAGDKDHSNSAKNCVTVNIEKANATVTADAQTVKESEDPKFSKDYAILSGAASGHSLGNVTITASGDKLVPSAATIVNAVGEDVTANYNVSYSSGTLTVIHKTSVKVTFSVANGEWDNGGSDDIEVVFQGYEGDTFKLAPDQIPAVGTKPAASYKKGDWDKTPDTDTEITGDTNYVYTYAEDPVYTVTVEGDGFVPGSGKDMVITVKCSINDSQTFSKFVSAKVDGSDLSDENCEKAPGSLILTIKSAYLDTLSTGSHNIEITFADGTATAAINIAKAPAPVPKTGETDSPFTFIGIMMLLAGVLGVLFEIRASRAPRRKVRQAPRAHGHRTREDE